MNAAIKEAQARVRADAETHTLPGGNRAANAHVALAFSTGSKRALGGFGETNGCPLGTFAAYPPGAWVDGGSGPTERSALC